jgi:hypothetical protein
VSAIIGKPHQIGVATRCIDHHDVVAVLDLGDRLGERDKLLRLVASQQCVGRSSLMRARSACAD